MIGKYVRNILLAGGAIAALALPSVGLGTKSDGPLSITINDGLYGEKDGLVDRINISSQETNIVLKREKHYDKFKELFDEADKLLIETEEEFKEYF